jgi:rhodanese-related sulfurtransferase
MAICCISEKIQTAYVCRNTLRALDFFVSLHLTIFEQAANFEFFNSRVGVEAEDVQWSHDSLERAELVGGQVELLSEAAGLVGCVKAQKNIGCCCLEFQPHTLAFGLADGHIMRDSMSYRFIVFFLGIFLFFSGVVAASEHVLSPLEAQKLIEENKDNQKFIIIDLRSKNEFDDGHIEGAKLVHYYATNFKRIISRFDTNSKILFYCQKGRQSPLALRDLEKMRFSDMYIIDGGFDAWVNAGLPTVFTSF